MHVVCVCVRIFNEKLDSLPSCFSALRTQLHFLKCYSNGLTLQGYKVKMKKRIFFNAIILSKSYKMENEDIFSLEQYKGGKCCCVLAVLVQMHGTGSERRRLHD